jgi:hypothetical protein
VPKPGQAIYSPYSGTTPDLDIVFVALEDNTNELLINMFPAPSTFCTGMKVA